MRSSSKTSTFRRVLTVLAAALAGCSSVVVSDTRYDGTYEPPEASFFPVYVSGAPFGEGGIALAEATVAAMRGHTAHPVEFGLAAAGMVPARRVVVMFNPPLSTSSQVLCGNPQKFPVPAPAAGGRLALSAVLCRGDRVLAGTFGFFTASGPGDPGFRDAIAAFTRELFPLMNRLTDSIDS